MTRSLLVACVLSLLPLTARPADHRCAPAAQASARKLLALHREDDPRIEIDPVVKTIAPLTNPANPKQTFDVLEVWGYIYKARYRMRFIYARSPGECLLMGQEVLEFASL